MAITFDKLLGKVRDQYVLPAGTGSIYHDNTLYVSKTGDDSTGTRGRADKPFLTISAAFAAATNDGDLIVVMPGTYNERLIGNKAGIKTNIFFHKGATLYYNSAAAVVSYSGTGYFNISILGYGTIYNTVGPAIEYQYDIEAYYVYSNGSNAIQYCTGTIKNTIVKSFAAVGIIHYQTSKILNCDVYGLTKGVGGNSGTSTILNCKIKGETSFGIETSSKNGGAPHIIKNNTIYGGTNGIACYDSADIQFNSIESVNEPLYSFYQNNVNAILFANNTIWCTNGATKPLIKTSTSTNVLAVPYNNVHNCAVAYTVGTGINEIQLPSGFVSNDYFNASMNLKLY